ncbi:YqeB family protein [Virgibacillus siamensis]|uniref:YqeB family protein n=1 Tax=Virgibacillus siamensis TaxID=480071 RepID=UPI000985179C|nr:ABC transporter permease [Virgibacillus siamensis]
MSLTKDPYHDATMVGLTKKDTSIIFIFLAIAGTVIGYFLPVIVGWLINIPIIPFQDLIKYILSLDGIWLRIICTALGFCAGLFGALLIINDTLHITVNDREINIKQGGTNQSFQQNTIQYIYPDNKQLVIVGNNGYELLRSETDEKQKDLRTAFNDHGYPWSDDDPYADSFQRWVEGNPDLSPAVNALMRARDKALQKDDKDEINDLRNELVKLGIIVRDEKKKQYWRKAE